MSLVAVSDGFLAGRAAAGDEAAFAELARRYRPLIGRLTLGPPAGVGVDDLRQEALLGLLDACRYYQPAKGPFPALARINVRWRVNSARMAARAAKHRILSHAVRDGEDRMNWLAERTPAPEGADPAVVVVLRDELRERAQRSRGGRRPDRRRRYSDAQITHALTLIAAGKTLKQAAFAVGAPPGQVARRVKRAGQPRPGGRRCFPAAEIRHAVTLVDEGASLRQAATAVGASSASVLRWLRRAA